MFTRACSAREPPDHQPQGHDLRAGRRSITPTKKAPHGAPFLCLNTTFFSEFSGRTTLDFKEGSVERRTGVEPTLSGHFRHRFIGIHKEITRHCGAQLHEVVYKC